MIDALEDTFDLAARRSGPARDMLHDYGNMSAATVLFVLQRMAAQAIVGSHPMSRSAPASPPPSKSSRADFAVAADRVPA